MSFRSSDPLYQWEYSSFLWPGLSQTRSTGYFALGFSSELSHLQFGDPKGPGSYLSVFTDQSAGLYCQVWEDTDLQSFLYYIAGLFEFGFEGSL